LRPVAADGPLVRVRREHSPAVRQIAMSESLLLAADNALYKAKREGRNRIDTALLMAPKAGRAAFDAL
jgi:hypothetical protein